MRVLLIWPPYKQREFYSLLAPAAPVLPPLGLAYIGAVLEKAGHVVKIIDAAASNLFGRHLVKNISDFSPDLIGITANSPSLSHALKTAHLSKSACPTVPVILGGYHPSFYPRELLSSTDVDYVAIGEGELTILELATLLELSDFYPDPDTLRNIRGLGWKRERSVRINEKREHIQNLDDLPLPAYHLLPMDKYRLSWPGSGKGREISAIVSRGCPFFCDFCTSPGFWGRSCRTHSPDRVRDLLLMLRDEFGIKHVQFRDDTFTGPREWVLETSRLLASTGMSWECYARFDTLDDELLRTMKDGGLTLLNLGVETANPESLKASKGMDPSLVEPGMEAIKKHGISARLFFMIGPPDDSPAAIRATTRRAVELDPAQVVATVTIPYPGSAFYSRLSKTQKIFNFAHSAPRIYQADIDLPGFTRKQLNFGVLEFYGRFYLRPKKMIQILISLPRRIWSILWK